MKFTYKSSEDELILEYKASQDGILSDIVAGEISEGRGWFGRWGNGVNSVIGAFTNGHPGNAAVGLACIAYGAYCAEGVAILCAIGASGGYFVNPI